MKIRELAQPFLDDCFRNARKESTLYGHKKQLSKIIVPAIGEKDVGSIRISDVGFVIERARLLGGVSTPNHAVITLRRLLRFAHLSGYKIGFDWREIEVPEYRRAKDVQALDKQGISEFRKALDGEKNREFDKHTPPFNREFHRACVARTRCLFEFLLHTGLRISEALKVDIADLDLERKELRIENIKTGTWDTVYLYGCVDHINEYLKYRKDEHPALFMSNSGVRLGLGTAKSTLARIKKRINTKQNLTHKLFRSTFVTTLLRGGCDPKQTQQLARHRSLQTTLDYYYKVEKEKLKPIHAKVMSGI